MKKRRFSRQNGSSGRKTCRHKAKGHGSRHVGGMAGTGKAGELNRERTTGSREEDRKGETWHREEKGMGGREGKGREGKIFCYRQREGREGKGGEGKGRELTTSQGTTLLPPTPPVKASCSSRPAPAVQVCPNLSSPTSPTPASIHLFPE